MFDPIRQFPAFESIRGLEDAEIDAIWAYNLGVRSWWDEDNLLRRGGRFKIEPIGQGDRCLLTLKSPGLEGANLHACCPMEFIDEGLKAMDWPPCAYWLNAGHEIVYQDDLVSCEGEAFEQGAKLVLDIPRETFSVLYETLIRSSYAMRGPLPWLFDWQDLPHYPAGSDYMVFEPKKGADGISGPVTQSRLRKVFEAAFGYETAANLSLIIGQNYDEGYIVEMAADKGQSLKIGLQDYLVVEGHGSYNYGFGTQFFQMTKGVIRIDF